MFITRIIQRVFSRRVQRAHRAPQRTSRNLQLRLSPVILEWHQGKLILPMKSESFCREFSCEHSFCSYREGHGWQILGGPGLGLGHYTSLRCSGLNMFFCLMNFQWFWQSIPIHWENWKKEKTYPNMSKLFWKLDLEVISFRECQEQQEMLNPGCLLGVSNVIFVLGCPRRLLTRRSRQRNLELRLCPDIFGVNTMGNEPMHEIRVIL